ncbi:YVTN repeat-like/Quino protein amine dehydrogenase [Parathielavia hyrcaniae]|uniref:YVTN repeat-like/Quino protein amine dehydrogenase n=1 Tax=Parathielavia hyrcaniae TaxID=113614 RepID=A0AAN6PS61_9PEZI|nr:YVTN repeat-like/Quino protein amine dehydrogenase [Parathielavia hyrcaniae]
MRMFSFYETLATTIGPVAMIVVNKSSAVMDYPDETRAPLDANHHDVCKFMSRADPNYLSILGALRNTVESLQFQPSSDAVLREDFRRVRDLLGATVTSEEDLCVDPMTVWDRLFTRALRDDGKDRKMYWVLDGLDKADSSKQVVDILTHVAKLNSNISILVFSRPLPAINQEFLLTRKKIHVVDMPLPGNEDDIRVLVADEVDRLLSSDDIKADLADTITARLQGNFLWASLVSKSLDLYDRMTEGILALELDEEKELGRIILAWALYSKNGITIDELSEIYPAEFSLIEDLHPTVSRVSGQLVAINPQGRVQLVHSSAVQYLESSGRGPFIVSATQGHEELLVKSLTTLCDKGMRRKLVALNPPRFLSYASVSWVSHLEAASPASDQVLDVLVRFFNGPFPLAWIQYLGMSGRLSGLREASRALTAYVKKRGKADAHKPPMPHRLTDLALLEAWAVDLIRLPARFGRHLSDTPSLIYECIPALSPATSILHQKYNTNPASRLSVSGVSKQAWDDSLARVSRGPGRLFRLAASSVYLAVAGEPRKALTIWDTELLEELQTFFIGEHIWALTFSDTDTLLACCSVSKIIVWKVADWTVQVSAEFPIREKRVVEFKFDKEDNLMMISHLKRVYRLRTRQPGPVTWEQQDPTLLNEPEVGLERLFFSTHSCVSFDNDCTKIAVAYPSFPPLVAIWTISPARMILRLDLALDLRFRSARGEMHSYTKRNKVVWHPSGTQVICDYGEIFRWNLENDTCQEVKNQTGQPATALACSPDGRLFIMADMKGSIKIYDVSSMSVVWQTLSAKGSITEISFSPDSLRFYELRWTYCNIWEPGFFARTRRGSI